MEFDKIVQKMRKKWQKLLTIREIAHYFSEWRMNNDEWRIPYKLIHRLTSAGILTSIRKGMYLWNQGEKLNPEDFYWPIVKKVIAENYMGQGIITGEKALWIALRDYSLPETLQIIVPQDKAKIAILGNYIMMAQTVSKDKKTSLYPILKKHSTRTNIEWVEFLISSPEHAILEALTIRSWSDREDTSTIERYLRKNASQLREAVFAEVVPYRYISAVNRLKYLSYDLEELELYKMMIRLIDREGKGCHLSREFLRGKRSLTWRMKNE